MPYIPVPLLIAAAVTIAFYFFALFVLAKNNEYIEKNNLSGKCDLALLVLLGVVFLLSMHLAEHLLVH